MTPDVVATDAPAGMRRLRGLVDGRLDRVWGDVPAHLAPLIEALDYSLLAPGKRVRPVLVLAAAACGGAEVDEVGVLDIACAFELVHAYSLVHDDLPCMDDDDLRRGMPTSHVRFGEGVAVLVGDALQGAAFELVSRAGGIPAQRRLSVVELLARAAGWRGMVGGQYLDIADTGRAVDDAAALRRVHDLKTGALLSAAVAAGGIVGGLGDAEVDACATFGAELGWLFQLVDDLLDETGDAARTGKSAGSDRRQGKVTAVQVFGGLGGARAAADEQLSRCLGLAAQLPDGGGLLGDVARYVRGRDR